MNVADMIFSKIHANIPYPICSCLFQKMFMWVCLKMLCTPKPNGFADHYPYEKWLSLGIYPTFSDKPMCFSVSCCQACALRLGHHLWTVATAAGARVTQGDPAASGASETSDFATKKLGFYWMLFSHDEVILWKSKLWILPIE